MVSGRRIIIRKTKEETALTRENILRAALQVFSRQGYAASTLEDIAREAGVTRGAVYWHFRGKAELYRTLLAEGSLRPLDVLNDIFSAGYSPAETLRRMLVRSLEFIEEDEIWQQIIELTLFKSEPGIVDSAGEGLEQKYQGAMKFAHRIEQLLREGVASGEIRADLDIQTAALSINALINGVILVWLQSSKAFSLKSLAASLADTYLNGVLTR